EALRPLAQVRVFGLDKPLVQLAQRHALGHRQRPRLAESARPLFRFDDVLARAHPRLRFERAPLPPLDAHQVALGEHADLGAFRAVVGEGFPERHAANSGPTARLTAFAIARPMGSGTPLPIAWPLPRSVNGASAKKSDGNPCLRISSSRLARAPGFGPLLTTRPSRVVRFGRPLPPSLTGTSRPVPPASAAGSATGCNASVST